MKPDTKEYIHHSPCIMKNIIETKQFFLEMPTEVAETIKQSKEVITIKPG